MASGSPRVSRQQVRNAWETVARGEVVVQAAILAALVVVQAEALLELAVVVLDPPAKLREPDERDQRCLGREALGDRAALR